MRYRKEFSTPTRAASVDTLGLSVRSIYLLKLRGVFNVGQLLTMPYGELIGLGKKDFVLIQAAIEQLKGPAKLIKSSDSLSPRSEKPPIPAWMLRWPIEGLELTTWTCSSLRLDGIRTVGDLIRLTEQKMKKLRWLKKNNIPDIQRAIGQLAATLELPYTSEVLIQSDQSLGYPIRILLSCSGVIVVPSTLPGELQSDRRVTIGGWLVPASFERRVDVPVESLGLSSRSVNVLNKCGIRFLSELLIYPRKAFSRTKNLGQKSIAELELKVIEYLSGQGNLGFALTKGIENPGGVDFLGTKELVNRLLACLGKRQRRVVAQRYGLWDGIVQTLEDVGHGFKLTRERIRQVEKKSLEQIRRRFLQHDVTEHLCAKVRKGLADGVGRRRGILTKPELVAAIADDCNFQKASLAVRFLQDVWRRQGDVFASSLIVVEEGVYCTDASTAHQYLATIERIESALDEHKRPLGESDL